MDPTNNLAERIVRQSVLSGLQQGLSIPARPSLDGRPDEPEGDLAKSA